MSFKFDTNIKVGDLITAYQKGFHRVTELTPGGSSGTLVHYKRVLSDKGRKSKGSIQVCDGSYCKKMDMVEVGEYIDTARMEFEIMCENLITEATKI
jgi:hypothetical protein